MIVPRSTTRRLVRLWGMIRTYDYATGMNPIWDYSSPTHTHLDQFSDYDALRNVGGASTNGMPPFFDIIARKFLRGSVVDFGYHDFLYATGLSATDSLKDSEYDRFYLRNWKYKNGFDTQPFSPITEMVGIMPSSEANWRFARDNNLRHYNTKGYLKRKTTSPPPVIPDHEESYYALTTRMYDFTWPAPWVSKSVFNTLGYTGPVLDEASTFLWDQILEGQQSGDALTVCRSLSRQVGKNYHGLTEFDPGIWNFTLDSFSYDLTPYEFQCRYTITTGLSQLLPFFAFQGTWEVTHRLELIHTGVTHPFPSTKLELMGMFAKYTCTYRFRGGYKQYVDEHGALRTISQGKYDGDILYSYNTPGDVRRFGPFFGSNVINSYERSYEQTIKVLDSESFRHGKRWADAMPTLQAANLFSTLDAVKSHFEVLHENYVEVLNEIGEIKELVPDGALLLKALTEIFQRKLTGLVKLGDFISSEHLKWNFGTAPNISVLHELNRLGPNLSKRFAQGTQSRTGIFQGKFFYPFLDAECAPYFQSSLSVRSTVQLTYCPTPTFKVLSDLYGAGILPTLERVWAVLPFSFVADWFTNMSARLAVVDLYALTLQVRFNWLEHTYEVSTPLPDWSPLRDYTEDASLVKHVYFARDLTLRIPCFVNDPLVDYLRVRSSPMTGIVAALVHQLTK